MSETKETALVRQPQRSFSLMPSSLGEAKELAGIISTSGFAPKGYENNPNGIMIAIQMGADLGLKPMQALQNIAVINGRPSIYGDAALALVMPALDRFHEEFVGTFPNDEFTAVCVSRRKGWPDETRTTFSIGDAKKANLWGKQGPWTQYPQRMLMWRARGFNVRTVGADLLLGLVLAEEAQDYPSIEGTVVASEVVPPTNFLDRIPEGLRDNVEKAFETLNLAPGVRLAKINEFMGGANVEAEAGAQAILDWARDEFAKRKTGQPRAKKGNAKRNAEDATGGPDPQRSAGDAGRPSDAPVGTQQDHQLSDGPVPLKVAPPAVVPPPVQAPPVQDASELF